MRADVDEDEENFSNNASLPEWKQECIKFYYSCIQGGWTGKCDDCLRYCEEQQKWPSSKCHER
ncbi:hypothetical protein DAT35_46800 [Vitiosangium sp. GDMCC 1.1324]|nr:hypothetical protein DAT35_46800 [Vitiosangium sp. GDMCC 1.1324]